MRTVWIHNLGDALSNVAIFVGALAIRWTGAQWVDPVIGMGIGAMVLWSGYGNFARERAHSARGFAARNPARRRCRGDTAGSGSAGSSRHPHLDTRHGSAGAFLPRSHSGYAHGRKRKDPREYPRSAGTRFSDHAHHDPVRTRGAARNGFVHASTRKETGELASEISMAWSRALYANEAIGPLAALAEARNRRRPRF